jgi:ABC-type uncharacterized transport system substrate-binding protein
MRFPLALALSVAALPALAHPHEFVEARLAFHIDAAGLLSEIAVEWRYDLFTSMLILTDLGLNPAATELSPDEVPGLQGFDLNWIPGYNGDLWVYVDGAETRLSGPVPAPASVEQGQVISRHLRRFSEPVDPRTAAVMVQVYDPEYYIAYVIAGMPEVFGAACRARVFSADMDVAYATLEAALAEVANGGEADLEGNFPRVGRDFADEVQLDCS